MWLKRRLELIHAHPGPIILQGVPAWGAPYLVAALTKAERPLVWLELEPRDEADPIAQGNKLADAVKRALGSPLFGYALPYGYGLAVLKTHLTLLGPFTFALSGAEHGIEFAHKLLTFQQTDNRVVLQFSCLPEAFEVPPEALLIELEALRLTREEAESLAQGKLLESKIIELWKASNGIYEHFLTSLHETLSLPAPLRPRPDGLLLPVGDEPEAEPAVLLTALLKRGQWSEALELAVRQLAERVPEVLQAAGEQPWTQGHQARLYTLLAVLPEPIKQNGLVLGWRFLSALTLGREREVLLEVEAALHQDNSPDLRALYAEARFQLGDIEGYLLESERALRTEETPLTLYTYGRALGLRDPAAGLALLEKGLRLAEARGERFFAAQITEALAGRSTTLGRYRAAANWAEWGLRLYDQEGLGQMGLRLALLNEWGFARILLGQGAGLEETLREEAHHLSEVHPTIAKLYQTTLADLLLSQGRADEALELYHALWQRNQRREGLAALANLFVRALLEGGKPEEALQIAEQTLELTGDLNPLYRQRGHLAHGMALSFTDPKRATAVLESVLNDLSKPLLASRLAQAGLHLARAYLLLGKREQARSALERSQLGLKELGETGIHYLAGPPEAFHEVFSLLQQDQPVLELRFLGDIDVRIKGEPVPLRPRLAEFLAVLVLNPKGHSGEQLTLAVYGESGDANRCKVELGRLRKLAPVLSKPYRLGAEIWADFCKVQDFIETGQLLEALTLYQGPLLPKSEAPEVVMVREQLEEALRQAVLRLGDSEALWTLAKRLDDDLTVWEATLASLKPGDPRLVIAQAKISTLSKAYGI